jgi:hypothetical protein
MKRIYVSTLVSIAAGAAALGLIAGCASNSGPASAASGGSSASGGSAFAEYAQCLSAHGVSLPSRAFERRSPGAGGFTARPSGGFGGGFGGAFPSADPTMAAALRACASDRPTNGFGRGFGAGSTRLAAFRTCMSQQGEPIPTLRPTAFASGDSRYLGGLSTADPKVAQALSVCKALIPTAAPTPAATSS